MTDTDFLTQSSRLYWLVTKYWPRIAIGIGIFVAGIEFTTGQLTSGWSLEFYFFAWAATVPGVPLLVDGVQTVETVREYVTGRIAQPGQSACLTSGSETAPFSAFCLSFRDELRMSPES